MLTFIVSLDDGVEAADTATALPAARPTPLILGGLHLRASHVRQRRGQAGVQLAVHPLASRALFGLPSAELPSPSTTRPPYWDETSSTCTTGWPKRTGGPTCSRWSPST